MLIFKSKGRSRLALAALLPALACTDAAEPAAAQAAPAAAQAAPVAAAAPVRGPAERIDMHVHLVEDATAELLAALDRHGIAQAVVLASPHLDAAHPPPEGDDTFADWRAANERLLAQTSGHRDRLLPFVTLDPAQVEAGEVEGWLGRGACGVKLYIGHHDLRRRPLADPSHDALFTLLEQRRVPLLLHVNTFRFEDELGALLRAHPGLEVVCAHLCGARTDLDRLERILRTFPALRVDTSHGAGPPGVEGFANLERERERMRRLIHAEPGRFLFGSDLVTATVAGNREATRVDWDRQIAANVGLLTTGTFEFWREGERPGSLALGAYEGLALDDAALASVLAGNARRWLAGCAR